MQVHQLCALALASSCLTLTHGPVAAAGVLNFPTHQGAVSGLAGSELLAQAKPAEAGAKQLFQRYVQLRNTFDPGILKLYAPNAVVKVWLNPASGAARSSVLPFKQYKELVLASLPTSKAKGDRSTFSKVTYQPEGSYVRINSERYSEVSRKTTPHSLLVGRDQKGQWMIYQETTEVQL